MHEFEKLCIIPLPTLRFTNLPIFVVLTLLFEKHERGIFSFFSAKKVGREFSFSTKYYKHRHNICNLSDLEKLIKMACFLKTTLQPIK